jgi:2-keto-4-pentenoate hydratase/2-oxohepta-3-ene-1,7-dioic acid hydratase in catechol pathway
MQRLLLALTGALGAAGILAGQAPGAAFKLGTFERDGRAFIGVVVDNDRTAIDLAAANAAYETRNPARPKVAIPADMRALIERYDALRGRIAEIVADAPRAGGASHPVASLKTAPPLQPLVMLNAAVNYTEHAEEMAGRGGPPPSPTAAPKEIPGMWMRRGDDLRPNPYLFLKAPTVITGSGAPIRIPPGRDQIDWECEFTVVIGKRAARIAAAAAPDVIFGYTMMNDVSDRGGRADGRHGSDWLIGKSHDTFAPLGPYITPREFIKDPQKLRVQFTLSGKPMQDSSTSRMIHTVYELVHYASNILTLQPGDVIATGSPAGVGVARKPPVFMKPGDVAVCTIEGVGSLSNPVTAGGS